LNLSTACSNPVIVGVSAPDRAGLPQFGFPRRFAIGLRPSFHGKPSKKTSRHERLNCGHDYERHRVKRILHISHFRRPIVETAVVVIRRYFTTGCAKRDFL
jgi:hypothetical protein